MNLDISTSDSHIVLLEVFASQQRESLASHISIENSCRHVMRNGINVLHTSSKHYT
jgi:hypothetical protein